VGKDTRRARRTNLLPKQGQAAKRRGPGGFCWSHRLFPVYDEKQWTRGARATRKKEPNVQARLNTNGDTGGRGETLRTEKNTLPDWIFSEEVVRWDGNNPQERQHRREAVAERVGNAKDDSAGQDALVLKIETDGSRLTVKGKDALGRSQGGKRTSTTKRGKRDTTRQLVVTLAFKLSRGRTWGHLRQFRRKRGRCIICCRKMDKKLKKKGGGTSRSKLRSYRGEV